MITSILLTVNLKYINGNMKFTTQQFRGHSESSLAEQQ